MSQIKIIDNLQDQVLNYEITDLQDGYFDLYFCFHDNTQPIVFNNLSFGYKLYQEDSIISEQEWPQNGIKYISSDQEYLEVSRIAIEYDIEYNLYVYASNNGNLVENNITLFF